MRSSYWSCSNFADWLRGTAKPGAQTSSGWADWRRQARTAHPVRYWIAEEGLDKVQSFIYWPADKFGDFRSYINNRFVSRSHALTAHPRDIKPGSWRDVGNRFVPCLFNELVDFVEIETAWQHVLWNEEERKKYQTPWWRRGWFRWRTWRCPEAGIAHLEWASTLTHVNNQGKVIPTRQATSAQEILDLYYWWTQEYPNRPDPHEVSGWTERCARRRTEDPDDFMPEDRTDKDRRESRRILAEIAKIEKQYHDEDTRMLIRLIKLRDSLWT